MRIAVVAPSCILDREAGRRLEALVGERGDCELTIHPQCFLSDGHFAGSDSERRAALREVMADPAVDAVWFARGGYGSNRIAEAAVLDLSDAARAKTYMGYSDSGFLHAAFDKAGLKAVWGPMPQDLLRTGGDAAITRALDWLVSGSPQALEAGLDGPAMAFNLTVLSSLLGTALEPDLSGIELLLEDVGEHHYRLDRTMFHLTASQNVRQVRQIRLGRISDIPANTPAFGAEDEDIVSDWCKRSGIAFGSRADIGHDSANKVVPFR
ncbi:MAG: LD-carboxypeptidase [Sphingomonas sp.]|nr:LD-carboxypeptidase [Sphingomonas sp.]